jgi:hypothetical protein
MKARVQGSGYAFAQTSYIRVWGCRPKQIYVFCQLDELLERELCL